MLQHVCGQQCHHHIQGATSKLCIFGHKKQKFYFFSFWLISPSRSSHSPPLGGFQCFMKSLWKSHFWPSALVYLQCVLDPLHCLKTLTFIMNSIFWEKFMKLQGDGLREQARWWVTGVLASVQCAESRCTMAWWPSCLCPQTAQNAKVMCWWFDTGGIDSQWGGKVTEVACLDLDTADFSARKAHWGRDLKPVQNCTWVWW